MSALALRSVTPAAFDWRAVLDEIGPQLAEEGRRCDENNQFAAANFELLRAREFLALVVPAELAGTACRAPRPRGCCARWRTTAPRPRSRSPCTPT